MTSPGPRQLACLRLAADGHTYGEISQQLYIAESTVRTQLKRVREILGARNTAQSVHIAHQRGLLGARRRLPHEIRPVVDGRHLDLIAPFPYAWWWTYDLERCHRDIGRHVTPHRRCR